MPLAIAALMGGASLLAIASPAEAVSCGSQSVTNADDGYIVLGHDANLQKAPYGACGTNALGKAGTKIWLWCAVDNDYGNTWYWGRIDKTETYGWVYGGDAKELEEKPTHNDGWCPGEKPADSDAIDGPDPIVEVPRAPEPEDSWPLQEFDAATDIDPTLPPIGGAEDDTQPADDFVAEEGTEPAEPDTGDFSAAAAAKLKYGAPITRAKVMARAKDWYKRDVQYKDGSHGPAWDINHGKKFRNDCSGFVSMAWALKTERSTSNLAGIATMVKWSHLKPGDMLLRPGHVQLFDKWANKSHTKFWVYQLGTPKTDMGHYTVTVKASQGGRYKPYMYKRIKD